MFSQSIRRKIVGIALGLVILMIGTSILSTLMANRVSHLLDELTNKYCPGLLETWRAHMCDRSRRFLALHVIEWRYRSRCKRRRMTWLCEAHSDLSDQRCRGCGRSRGRTRTHRLDHRGHQHPVGQCSAGAHRRPDRSCRNGCSTASDRRKSPTHQPTRGARLSGGSTLTPADRRPPRPVQPK